MTSKQTRASQDPAPRFFCRGGRWREPQDGDIIYLPGETQRNRVDGDCVWMEFGKDSRGRARWTVRLFKLADLHAYSLVEPQYTQRKRSK